MRITNAMMMNNTKSNINNNKILVDKKNTQMSTQKKITKPSDDPLIAIKALRLSTTLSQINQYLGKNIEDAESWIDVTETALNNMKDVYTDAYRLAVNGATDTLQDSDRQTILSQLKSLGEQIYSEANADYAGRAIFAGYKTNSTVTFQDSSDAKSANYQIDEPISYKNFEEKTYYANGVGVPTRADVDAVINDSEKTIALPEDLVLNRLRLSYTGIGTFNGLGYTTEVNTSNSENAAQTALATVNTMYYMDKTTGEYERDSVGNPINYNTFVWQTKSGDSKFEYYAGSYDGTTYSTAMTNATFMDKDGKVLQINTDAVFGQDNCGDLLWTRDSGIMCDLYTDNAGNVVFKVFNDNENQQKVISDADGNSLTIKYDEEIDKSGTMTDANGAVLTIAENGTTSVEYNGSTLAAETDPTNANHVLYKDGGKILFSVLTDTTNHIKTISDSDGNVVTVTLNATDDAVENIKDTDGIWSQKKIHTIIDAQGNVIDASGGETKLKTSDTITDKSGATADVAADGTVTVAGNGLNLTPDNTTTPGTEYYKDDAGNIVFTVVTDKTTDPTKPTTTITDSDGNITTFNLDATTFAVKSIADEWGALKYDNKNAGISVTQGTKDIFKAELADYTEIKRDA
ncbi:MAG: flagellar hook-associated protein FlgL, partial [Lachnospiraceae bacterium]|nr:flagellar hook-associated protein FlgL [Lachnospiraceae bacterium]